jgi:membrane protease YdiL (CAAX protease family)
LSWAIWLPLMLVRFGWLQARIPSDALVPLALPGVLMPSVAALLLSKRRWVESAGGLLRRLWIWRVGVRWWLFVLLVQPTVLLFTAWVLKGFWNTGPLASSGGQSLAGFPLTLVLLVVASVGEELGWRGYALPHLQATHSPRASALLLALLTATWHLPYWALQGIVHDFGWGYLVLDYVFIVALTLQIVVVFNRTHQSVLVPVVFHVVFNAVNVALVPVTSSVGGFALLTALELLIAGAMVGRLGLTAGAKPPTFPLPRHAEPA